MHYASVESISKSFGIRTLFTGITLNIEEGDKIALVARNGSGKSTLMNIIAGSDTPDSGKVWVHKDIKTVMLQQDHVFQNEKSIWDNILKMDNPVVKAVKEYEEFLEEEKDDSDMLGELMAKIDDLNAWSFNKRLCKCNSFLLAATKISHFFIQVMQIQLSKDLFKIAFKAPGIQVIYLSH